ncbi:hypothetical protein [Micromonospora sp. DPT]|uniref:hypothetical protein n=1 Tax=Micromonospora sp. DPT TaxID=3142975 RepID=UPI0032089048
MLTWRSTPGGQWAQSAPARTRLCGAGFATIWLTWILVVLSAPVRETIFPRRPKR